MNLYNCISEEEIALKNTDLKLLSTIELLNLAKEIKKQHENCVLIDEEITISALEQIIEELYLAVLYQGGGWNNGKRKGI